MSRKLRAQMEVTVTATTRALAPLRGGRASTDLVNHIRVMVYGSKMPIEQVASVSVVGPRSLVVAPYDDSTTGEMRTAIEAANLGATPSVDAGVIRINLPATSGERRIELKKLAKAEAERGRVALRNTRRDGINSARRAAKAGDIAEGKRNRQEKEISALCDEFIRKIDDVLTNVLRDLDE